MRLLTALCALVLVGCGPSVYDQVRAVCDSYGHHSAQCQGAVAEGNAIIARQQAYRATMMGAGAAMMMRPAYQPAPSRSIYCTSRETLGTVYTDCH